jgi:hypothetical protein
MTRSPKSSPVSLRSLALDQIASIAEGLRKSDPSLTPAAATVLAAKSPEGREAYRIYTTPGMGGPLFETLEHMAKGEVFQEKASMRDVIIAKRALAKEGGSGGSGPRGGMIEDPKLSGPVRPADTLPAQPAGRKVTSPVSPADAILADIHAQALRAAPFGTSQESATSAFLQTTTGQQLHAQWNAVRRLQGETR